MLIAIVLAQTDISTVMAQSSFYEYSYVFLKRAVHGKLVSFSNPDSLELYWRTLALPDPVMKIVHASRLVSLRGNSGDEIRLLSVMPQSELEFDDFGMLTYARSPEWDNADSVAVLPYRYGGQVARAVVKHTKYLGNFLRFAALTQGEYAEGFAGECSFVLEERCVSFLRVLSTMHPQIEDAVLDLINYAPPDKTCLLSNKGRIPKRYRLEFGLY